MTNVLDAAAISTYQWAIQQEEYLVAKIQDETAARIRDIRDEKETAEDS